MNIDLSLDNPWNRRVYLLGGAGVVATSFALAIQTSQIGHLLFGAGYLLLLAPVIHRPVDLSQLPAQEDQILLHQRQERSERAKVVCQVAGLALMVLGLLLRWLP